VQAAENIDIFIEYICCSAPPTKQAGKKKIQKMISMV
jgi:hypothetical protein